jgi:hypothetical protein
LIFFVQKNEELLFQVIGVQKFKGELSSDLSFERNEILDIIRKPEEGWWQARNSMGTIGMIPVNYVQKVSRLD